MNGSIVLWSGGLDSTAILYQEVERGASPLYVHHVILRDSRNRWGYESAAIARMMDWFSGRYGRLPFFYSEGVIDSGPGAILFDLYVATFAGAQCAIRYPDASRVLIGLHAGEIGTPLSPAWRRSRKALEMFMVLTEQVRNQMDLACLDYPLAHTKKAEILNLLPVDLRALTFSCQWTRNGVYCGECITCRDIIRAGSGPEFGIPAAGTWT